MRSFLTRFLAVFLCLVFLFVSLISVPTGASYYQNEEPFKSLCISGSSSYASNIYNYDYIILYASRFNTSDSSVDCYSVALYLISDSSDFKGKLYFSCGNYPDTTFLYSGTHETFNITTNYSFYQYSLCNVSKDIYLSPSNTTLYFRSTGNGSLSSNLNRFSFDTYNFEKFPVYQGASSVQTSGIVLASNVDLYDYNGNLLQYGNYYTLLQYFDGGLDPLKIHDYSGHETAPGVVVEPTTDSSSGGTAGDNGTSQEQLETSKGILGAVKDIFNSIASLPEKIAGAISGFFTDLKDGLLEGIKFLFVPSDNLFDDLVELVKSKFGFVFQVFEIADFILTLNVIDTPPDLSFIFPEDYQGNSRFVSFLSGIDFELIDWSVVEPYRQFIRGLIMGIAWYFFIKKLPARVTNAINGVSGGGD